MGVSLQRSMTTETELPSPSAEEATAAPDLDDPQLYLNRELSLLQFFWRVLEEARDERNPLLERVKFLAIVGSNLDEFFMVRVAGLRQQIEAGVGEMTPDGLTPAEQLAAIRQAARELMQATRACFRELMPLLHAAGIHLLDYEALDATQRARAGEFFEAAVFPVLTPLAVDPGRPFPHISNRSLNLAVLIEDQEGRERFARVKVPDTLPRLVPLQPEAEAARSGATPPRHDYVWLEQLVRAHLADLFPGMRIREAYPFRVTRNAGIEIQELEASDLLETIEEGVKQRRFGSVVRLTVNPDMPERIRDLLVENLEMDPRDVYVVEGLLGSGDLMGLYAMDRPDLKDSPFVPPTPPGLDGRSAPTGIFAAIRQGDILLHHPYDSFAPVVEFLRQAARDPAVLAIKQTLYRVGRNSPVVEALQEANENGKQVAVLVELKARFDEESNIGWARRLEAAGVHVVYGLLGLKTHSKIALVVRKEGDQIRRYMHLATGNYNTVTAYFYTDLGLFTDDEAIGADATDLFNYLTGYSAKTDYRKLLVAPINLRSRMEALIEREIRHQRESRGGHLIFKMNSLVDRPVIQQLYRASHEGVKIDLVVRGMCGLRPGVPGLSENIRVLSLVGRFLEHSRIFSFANGGDEEIYLGSADLMPRNIDRRVEILFPVEDPRIVRYLRDEVLAACLADTANARRLGPDGSYERVRPSPGEPPMDSQAYLLDYHATRALVPAPGAGP